MTVAIPTKDAGRWMAAATVEKYADEASFHRARALFVDAGKRAWERAERELLVSDHCPSCTWTPERGAEAHDAACPLTRFRPIPGGNPSASADVRQVIERYWEDAFGIEARDGVLDTSVRVSEARLRALADSELDLSILLALREQYAQTLGARNGLLNEGINEMWTIVCNGSAADSSSTSNTRWNNANARIGVGTSTTAFAATHTNLQATGTAKKFVAMDASFPTFGTSQLATWKSTFGSGVAEVGLLATGWQEWSVARALAATWTSAVDDDSNAGVLNLNRKVENLGVKPTSTVWTLQVQCSLA